MQQQECTAPAMGSSEVPPVSQAPCDERSGLPSVESSPQSPMTASKSDQGFWSWSKFAQKAKAVLLEDGIPSQVQEDEAEKVVPESPAAEQVPQSIDCKPGKRMEAPVLQKGLDAIASSLSLLGGTLGTAIEEGLSLVETKASEMMTPEPRHTEVRKSTPLWKRSPSISPKLPQQQTQEKGEPGSVFTSDTQLKASRDVAMAMASKAKMLLRELKTLKGDMAFLRDRCAQLEEENKRLRESVVKGVRPDEDDLVRLQLETLLAEKGRLQQENANYARENQFLHEVVEYHQIEFSSDDISADRTDELELEIEDGEVSSQTGAKGSGPKDLESGTSQPST